LAELAAATTANTKALAEVKAAAVGMEHAKADVASREAALQQWTVELDAARQELSTCEERFKADQEGFADRTAQLAAARERMLVLDKGLGARKAELDGREKNLDSREMQAAAREDALKVAEAAYAKRVARLKELAAD
jgi:chromosome segregation ATPase